MGAVLFFSVLPWSALGVEVDVCVSEVAVSVSDTDVGPILGISSIVDIGQAGTAGECFLSDGGDALGNGYSGQTITVIKRAIATLLEG